MNFEALLRFAVKNKASDIHLQAGSVPMLRISGQMRPIEGSPLAADEARQVVASIVPKARAERIDEAIVDGLDFGYEVDDLARFRCNVFSNLGRPGLVMRIIRPGILSIAELNLPDVLSDIALARRGLTLLAGTTGSGKSTTLAAMIDLINASHPAKIITIEDPVEYVHRGKKALISQLELGSDTPSFDQALRQALRQDPDVILVGELRDTETLRMALRAADTGHQVFSTVHSSTAPQTVERLIAMIPPAERKLTLSQLASSIEAIVCQRLITTREGGLRAAVEILRGGPVTAKYVLEDRVADLNDYMETHESGMQRFDQHLLKLYEEGVISGTEALRRSTTPEALALAMRGSRRPPAARPDRPTGGTPVAEKA